MTDGMEDYFSQPAPPETTRTPQPPPGARPGWAPPRDEQAVVPAPTTMGTAPVLPLVLLLAGAAAVVSAFLPWLKVFVVGVSGTELGDVDLFPGGWAVLALGALVVGVAVAELGGRGTTGLRAAAAAAGLAITGVALGVRAQIDSVLDELPGLEGVDGAGAELFGALLPHAGAGRGSPWSPG